MGVKMFDRADPSQKQTEIFQDISGGVNTEIADEAMPDNQRRAIVNLDIDSGGYAKKRPGLHRIPWVTALIWSKLNVEYQNGNIDDLTSLLVNDVYMFYDGANYIVNYITNKGLVVLILTSDMLPVNTNATTGAILSDDVQVVQPVQFYKDILYNVRISDYSTQYILVSTVYRITPDYTLPTDTKQVRYFSWCPIQDPLGPNKLTKGWVEACEQDETPVSQTFYGETQTLNMNGATLSFVTAADLVNNFYIGNQSTFNDDAFYYKLDSDANNNMFIQCISMLTETIIWEEYITNYATQDYLKHDDVYNAFISIGNEGQITNLVIVYGIQDGVKTVTYNNKSIDPKGQDNGWFREYTVSLNVGVNKYIINTLYDKTSNTATITLVDGFPKFMTTAPFAFSAQNVVENFYFNGKGAQDNPDYGECIGSATLTETYSPYIALGSYYSDNSTIINKAIISKDNRSFYVEDGCVPIPVNCSKGPFINGDNDGKNAQFQPITMAVLWDYDSQESTYTSSVNTDSKILQSALLMRITDPVVANVWDYRYAVYGDQIPPNTPDNPNPPSISSTSFLWRTNTLARYIKALKSSAYTNNGTNDQQTIAFFPSQFGMYHVYPNSNGISTGIYNWEGSWFCVNFVTTKAAFSGLSYGGADYYPGNFFPGPVGINFYIEQYKGQANYVFRDSPLDTSHYTYTLNLVGSGSVNQSSFTDKNSYYTTVISQGTASFFNSSNSSWSSNGYIDAIGPNLGTLYQQYLGYYSNLNYSSFDIAFLGSTVKISNTVVTKPTDFNGFKNFTFTWMNKYSHTILAYTPHPIAVYKIADGLQNYMQSKTYKLSDFFDKDVVQQIYNNRYSIASFSSLFVYNNNSSSTTLNIFDGDIQDYNSIDFIEDLLSVDNWDQPIVTVQYLYFYRYCFKIKVVINLPLSDNTSKEITILDFTPDQYNIAAIQDGSLRFSFEVVVGVKADNPALFTQQQYTIPNINDYSYLWYNLSNFNVRVDGLTPNISDPTVHPFLPPEMIQYPVTESADNSPLIVSSIVPVNSVVLQPGDNQRFQVFWAENVLSDSRRPQIYVNWYIGSMDDYNTMITQNDYSTSKSLNWVELKSSQTGDTSNFVQTNSLKFQNNDQGQKVWYADINIPTSNQILLIQFNMIATYGDTASGETKATDKDPATYRSTSLQLDPASTTQTKIDVPSVFDEFVSTNRLITYRSSLVSYGKTNKLFFSEISNPTYFPLKWVLEMPTNEAVTCCTIFQNQLVVSTENQKFYVSGVSFDDSDNPFEIHSITQEAGAVNDQCEHSFQDRLFFHDSGGFKALKNLYSTTEKEFNYVTMDTDIKSLIPSDKTGMLIVTLEDKLYIHYPSNKSMIIYNAKLNNFTTYQSDMMNFKKMYVVNGKLYCIAGAQGMGSDMFKIWYFDKDTYVDDWNPEEDGYETVLIPFENNIAHRVQKGVWFECYLKTKNLDLEYPYHWKKLNEITVTTATDQLTTIVNPEIEFDNNRINYTLDLYRDISGKLVYQIDNPNTLVIRTGTKVDNTWILGKTKLGDQETTQHQMNIGRPARTFALGLRHKYPLPITFMNFNVRYGILKNRPNTNRKIS